MHTNHTRQGTILIIVAGICALLASMALTFLARMRSDLEESQLMVQEAQARIMLSAACNWLQEASRLGYDTAASSATNFHLEGHGWIDVRDGSVGPKTDVQAATNDTFQFFRTNTNPGFTPTASGTYIFRQADPQHFPIGTSRRFDMYMKEIPPFAIRLDAAPNPIDPSHGIPWLARPDPMPVLPSGAWNWNNPTDNDFDEFERGDPRPVQNSVGMAWFRLHRCGPNHPTNPHYAKYNAATFIVTVGAGGTRGFRFYGDPGGSRTREMSSSDEQFFGSKENFLAMQNAEFRQWYLVEWSPAVGGQLFFNTIHHRTPKMDANGEDYAHVQYAQFPQNRNRYTHSQGKVKNFGGTIAYVQRLTQEPPEW